MGLIRKELEIIITNVTVLSVCNEYEKTGTIFGAQLKESNTKLTVFLLHKN